MIVLVYGMVVVGACSYVMGRLHGYAKYEQIERESKTWSEV